MKNWSLHFFINNTISPCAGFPLRFVWVGVESDSVWTPPKLGLGVSGASSRGGPWVLASGRSGGA